jgi:hypothetical protein
MPAKKKEKKGFVIEQLKLETIVLQIVGIRPLIVHAWDPKTQAEMLAKQMKIPVKGAKQKERNPQAEYEAALYRIPEHMGGGYGVPAAAFKQSFVDACRHVDLKMTEATGAFHVRGIEVPLPEVKLVDPEGNEIKVGEKTMEMIPIFGSKPEMRMDMVRLEGGSADLRFRPYFMYWWCLVPVQVAVGSMTPQQVTDLANRAGFHCGVCEWRPFSKKSKNGTYGMYKIASNKDEHKLFKGKNPPVFESDYLPPKEADLQ